VGVGVGLAVGDGDGLPLADGDALGLADGEGLPLGDGDPLGLALADALALAEGEGFGVGARATGCEDGLGRAAKNRGGRLNVGTSSQKGACGSSAKYRLASGSAALPLTSIRNGPISQSAGIERTRKKTRIRPAKNSRNPNRRRRRRFFSPLEVSTSPLGFCAFTGTATASRTTSTSTGVGLPPSGTMACPSWAGIGAAAAIGLA